MKTCIALFACLTITCPLAHAQKLEDVGRKLGSVLEQYLAPKPPDTPQQAGSVPQVPEQPPRAQDRETAPSTSQAQVAAPPQATTKQSPGASATKALDILGIKPGGSGIEARKLLAAHNKNFKFTEMRDGDRPSGLRAVEYDAISEKEDVIVLVHPGTDRIWFVNRRLRWHKDPPLTEDLIRSLADKYGVPDERPLSNSMVWARGPDRTYSAASSSACKAVLAGASWGRGAQTTGVPSTVNPQCGLGMSVGWLPDNMNRSFAYEMWATVVDAASMFDFMQAEAKAVNQQKSERAKSVKPSL